MAFEPVQTAYAGGTGPYSTSALAFDPLENLLWTGHTGGYVSSYHSSDLAKYSSYASTHSPIAGLAALPSGILSVGNDVVRLHSRQGLCQYSLKHDSFQTLQCMTESHGGTTAWVSGGQATISAVDVTTGTITNSASCSGDHVVLRNNQDRFICAGTSSGNVFIHDPSSLRVLHTMAPHGGAVSDLDVSGNMLVTCGYSQRNTVERHLMVYDLRMFQSMAPCQVPIGPSVVRYVPAYATSLLALDETGSFLICNPNGVASVDSMTRYELPLTEETAYYTVAISPNSHFLAFGDTSGVIHLWGDSTDEAFNNYNEPCVMADERPELPSLDIDDVKIPFSSIPMPWTNTILLSDMSEDMYHFTSRSDPPIDAQVLSAMKVVDFVGYAPNVHGRRRNQMPYVEQATRRGKGKKNAYGAAVGRSSSASKETDLLKEIPKCYRPVKLRYSRLGLADFDFKQHNHTSFPGLEINIPNAYCNSMLQVFYFLEPLKAAMQTHFCEKTCCLACELGFLFNMLDASKCEPCQASNFLRAFRSMPEAQAMGLLFKKDIDAGTQLSQVIQRWSRFVLQQLVHDSEPRQSESMQFPPLQQRPLLVTKLFTSTLLAVTTCKECGSEESKPYNTLQWSMTYPRARIDDTNSSSSSSSSSSRPVARSFSAVLCGSILREQSTMSFCKTCDKIQSSRLVRSLRHMPHVLCINCQADSPMEQELWRQQQELVLESLKSGEASGPHGQQLLWKSWLPTSLRVSQRGEELSVQDCSTIDGPQDQRPQSIKTGIYYDLMASVAHIDDGQSAGALIAHVKVSANYHLKKENVNQTQWYVFNDFAVNPVAQDSAVDFGCSWKVPCVLFYARRDLNHLYDLSVRQRQDPNVLVAALPRANPVLTQVVPPVRVLQIDELPQRSQRVLVGLDAEFVVLNQEEAELAIDGTKTTIKPSCLCLARITAVRGSNKLLGVPFIDDHIATSEQVVDYLTKYSGIKPGDLDPNVSTKHLVTLKQAYRKLKYLVDCGVCFVGHGLKKDFRVINMLVPAEQVLDTVELFHLPNQRYVSLRFLAWFFSNLHIQSVMHDSIEDALTAVTLYRRYMNLRRQNELTDALKRLYDAGRRHNWQVPPPSTGGQ